MFFGIDIEKIVIIAVVAALLLGPEKLPHYAEMLAKFTVRARDWLNGARSRVREEMGEEFDEIEWRKLDPRQYDPRRIIRDALLEDSPPTPPSARTAASEVSAAAPVSTVGAPAPDPVGPRTTSAPGRSVAVDDAPVEAAPITPAQAESVPFDSEAT
jgi:sec-independent protein translocase protein TatB